MKITKKEEAELITVNFEGRLDKISSPAIEEELKPEAEKGKDMILDFKELLYISSAGLRILIALQKELKAKGKNMTIINPNEDVLDILKVTGFIYILNVKV